MTVRDKVVIVTGAALGIGRFAAGTFAAAGAKVAVCDVLPMDRVVGEVEALGGSILALKCDVSSEDEVRAFIAQVHHQYGRIDVLLNNAAIVTHFPRGGRERWPLIRSMDYAFFQKVMNTNLGGTFLCTKHAIPYMAAQGGGVIINVGQGTLKAGAHYENLGSAIYSTSKVAIRGFTQRMAPEVRDLNICVISMGPGSGGEGSGGIATEETPDENRSYMRPLESVGNRFVIAADAPMELSGNQVEVRDGELQIMSD